MMNDLSMSEQNLFDARDEFQNLAVDPVTALAVAGAATSVVEKGLTLVGDAVDWADRAAEKAADSKRIGEVLDFIRKE